MIEEYEIQHYGFTIAELKQESNDWKIKVSKNIISIFFSFAAADMIRDEVDKSCEILVQSIITNPEVDSKVAAEINRKKKILASELKDLFKESLDEMGNIMTDTFSIPANVTLSTDQLKLKSVDASEVELQEIFDEKMKRFKMVCWKFFITS